jgi:hypothetical protein
VSKGALCWYRLETGADGKIDQYTIRTVDRVEDDEGKGVFYVQATNQQDAIRKAWLAYGVVYRKKLRAERLAAGECQWCGKSNDRGGTLRCSVCREKQTGYGRAYRAKARGEAVERIDGRTIRKETAAAQVAASRADILREVLRHYYAAQGNGRLFTAWLNDEIAKLAQKEVA